MENEDLSASVPEGFNGSPVVDDPVRPGVRTSDLHRARVDPPIRPEDPAWMAWTGVGVMVVLGGGVIIAMNGMAGVSIVMGLATLSVLIFIAAQVWKIANRK